MSKWEFGEDEQNPGARGSELVLDANTEDFVPESGRESRAVQSGSAAWGVSSLGTMRICMQEVAVKACCRASRCFCEDDS